MKNIQVTLIHSCITGRRRAGRAWWAFQMLCYRSHPSSSLPLSTGRRRRISVAGGAASSWRVEGRLVATHLMNDLPLNRRDGHNCGKLSLCPCARSLSSSSMKGVGRRRRCAAALLRHQPWNMGIWCAGRRALAAFASCLDDSALMARGGMGDIIRWVVAHQRLLTRGGLPWRAQTRTTHQRAALYRWLRRPLAASAPYVRRGQRTATALLPITPTLFET